MKFIKYDYLIIGAIACIMLLLTVGDKLLHINELSFDNHYDVLKNYYTYLYYITISDDSILTFDGMNYPYTEHIVYTDNSPILAIIVKTLGLGNYAVGIFNGLILFNLVIAPIIAYAIGKSLNLTWYINIVFSVFVVWMHPQQFNIFSSSNLSLSSLVLLSLYLAIQLFTTDKKNPTGIYLSIIALIFTSSFIHLYYLMLNAFIFLPAFCILLFSNRKKAILGILSTLVGVGFVFLSIRMTDIDYALRPKGDLGFNYHVWRGELINFFKSYYFLDLPYFLKHEKYTPYWYCFLGTAFPIVIISAVFYLVNAKKGLISFFKSNILILPLLLIGTVSAFTAIGNDIIIGRFQFFNFLNPLYLASFVTDIFNNFRFLSRFNFISFIVFTTLGYYLLNLLILKYHTVLAKTIVGLCIVISLVDVYGMVKFQKKELLDSNSIFTKSQMSDVPLFTKTYDAILTLPYYNVGSETTGYIIDDNDDWSHYTYQLSIKNELPLLASKLSRTPPPVSKKLFSLFQEEPDDSLLLALKGKSIIIVLSQKYDSVQMNDEPSKSISNNKRLFIEKWNPTYLYTKDEVEYYEMIF